MTIGGICPVLAVPFGPEGGVDAAGFRQTVEHVLALPVTAVTLFGLASEFYKLTDVERDRLRDVLLDVTNDRPDVTAIVSITDHATEVAVTRAREAVAAGADALNVLPPHFLSPAEEAVTRHLEAVLAAVEVPVVVQYAPTQTGTSLDADSLRELARRRPNLTHVKVETQPPGRYVELLQTGDPPLPGLVGYAGVQMPDALRRGAVGVQPGCSFTELYVELWRRHVTGETEGFEDLYRSMLPYLTYWMQHVELVIQAEKTILHRRGIIEHDGCRGPGWQLDDEESAMIDRFLDRFAQMLVS